MGVQATIAIASRIPLVQKTVTDPKELILWSDTATADATGNEIVATLSVPSDLGCMWLRISAQIIDSSASELLYGLTMAGVSLYTHGVSGVDINAVSGATTKRVFPALEPPAIILSEGTITAQCVCDNVLGDDMAVVASAFVWDIQVARNLPQRYFWPQRPA